MSFEHYIQSGGKMLRRGYTTGACAAMAAAGAAELLLTGAAPETVGLTVPGGLFVEVAPALCRMEGDTALCAVKKDGGDDPDVTDGLLVCAAVSRADRGVEIDGGEGVGRVTRPGLDQPVGNAAINSVPRKMIVAAAERVCAEAGYFGGLRVVISVPGGAEAARKTINPLLGVVGGVSILGTSGIVEPMSEKAVADTAALEIRQAAAEKGAGRLVLVPGNYGADFWRERCPAPGDIPLVKCSNFIGEAVDAAALAGFRQVLLVGHMGKLVKLAGGIMNTHSRAADCRRELICAHAALAGAGRAVCAEIMGEVATDGCIAALDRAGLRRPVTESLLAAMQEQLARRAAGRIERIGAAVFSNVYGLLGLTEPAREIIEKWGVKL